MHAVITTIVILTFLATNSSSAISSADIQKGGTYHLSLATGDEFEGTISEKTDSSVVIETTGGQAFTFAANLILDYKLLVAPKAQPAQSASVVASGSDNTTITFEALRQKRPTGQKLIVTMNTGASFNGVLQSIDDAALKLNIDGSAIPIAKEIIKQIELVMAPSASTTTPAQPLSPSIVCPCDTIILHNPKKDDYGHELNPLTIVGRLLSQDAGTTTYLSMDSLSHSVSSDQIIRVVQQDRSGEGVAAQIARYAKPLFCPKDMVLVDIPPVVGTERPFFKVCVDKYEYPNSKDVVPQINISYIDAMGLCAKAGKRLCSADEWKWTCGGREQYAYPYGHNFEKEACNTNSGTPEVAGQRFKCIGKFGASDMTGNVFEWVSGSTGGLNVMGGPLSKCQTLSPGFNGEAKPYIGLRCCKSN